jgi:aspartate/methionine/tyrosine aminotransferase
MNNSHHLSDAASRIERQPMFKALDKIQNLEKKGEHIIHFEIDDPDFSTQKHIIETACDSLYRGKHITPVRGVFMI